MGSLTPLYVVVASIKADPIQHAAAAMIATALSIFVFAPPLISDLMITGWVLLLAGIIFSRHQMPPVPILVGAAIIVASAITAAVVAYDSVWAGQTVVLAGLTAVLCPLVFVRNPAIFQWLIPSWVMHGVWSLLDSFVATGRVTGLSDNANIASAFLLIGFIYLSNGNSRLKWLVIPLVAALPFTGSRWATLVMAALLIGMFGGRYLPWRYLLVGIGLTILAVSVLQWGAIFDGYYRPSTMSIHIIGEGPQYAAPTESRWVPRGFWDSGIHNVPWRMANETGLVSAIAWIGVSLYGLARDRGSPRWWMLMAIVLISMMYYHTWVGALGGFWWLLITPNTREKEKRGMCQVSNCRKP